MNLFDYHVARILQFSTEVAGTSDLLSRLYADELITPAYDLRASARNLREAAAKLDAICDRSTDNAV